MAPLLTAGYLLSLAMGEMRGWNYLLLAGSPRVNTLCTLAKWGGHLTLESAFLGLLVWVNLLKK